MNYPVWDVPIIGSGWVIGGIAIFHVLVSHFAIGGGFYLPMAERKALREGRDDWLEVIRGHAKFFLVLTLVFGAVTGVAIWFSIGLASPEGTSTLIHNFVFGWAIEWVFFIVEITAATVYYYTWGKIDSNLHMKIGWIYAISAWLSLVIINGILTFMLTPGSAWLGVAGTGTEASKFWQAFFNPTYFPSVVLRTLICIALAGVWALVTASRIDGFKQPELKKSIIRWSSLWLLPAFVALPFCFGWYLYMVPESRLALLQIGISNIGAGTFTQVTRTALVTVMTSATIAAVVYFMAWRNPRHFGFGHACAVLLLALAATASTEYGRELLRKPYVIADHMYSNGVRKSEVEGFNRDGYLTKAIWLDDAGRAALQEPNPTLEQRLAVGELVFRGQCMACHTTDGYRPIRGFLAGRDRESIGNILKMLHDASEDSPYVKYMPPLVGTAMEIESLNDFLYELVKPEETGKVAAAVE